MIFQRYGIKERTTDATEKRMWAENERRVLLVAVSGLERSVSMYDKIRLCVNTYGGPFWSE